MCGQSYTRSRFHSLILAVVPCLPLPPPAREHDHQPVPLAPQVPAVGRADRGTAVESIGCDLRRELGSAYRRARTSPTSQIGQERLYGHVAESGRRGSVSRACWPPLRTGQEGTFGGDRRDIVLDPLGAGGALAFANPEVRACFYCRKSRRTFAVVHWRSGDLQSGLCFASGA